MGTDNDYSNRIPNQPVIDSGAGCDNKDHPEVKESSGSLRGKKVKITSPVADRDMKPVKDKVKTPQKQVKDIEVFHTHSSPTKNMKESPEKQFSEESIKKSPVDGLLRVKDGRLKVGDKAEESALGGAVRKLPVVGEWINKRDQERYHKEAKKAAADIKQRALKRQDSAFGWRQEQLLDLETLSLSEARDKIADKPEDLKPLQVLDDNITSKDCFLAKKGELLIIDETELDHFKLNIDPDGHVIWQGEILDTSRLLGVKKEAGVEVLEDVEFKIVMDKKGNIYGAPHSSVGPYRNKAVVHSCLAVNDWPVAAGNIHTDQNGKIIYLDNTSGHFCPMEQNLRAMVNVLKSKNAIEHGHCEIQVVAKDSSVFKTLQNHPRTKLSFSDYREKVLSAAKHKK